MTNKDRKLYEDTIEDLKKLDYQSLVILQAGIKMLAAYQKIDKKPAA